MDEILYGSGAVRAELLNGMVYVVTAAGDFVYLTCEELIDIAAAVEQHLDEAVAQHLESAAEWRPSRPAAGVYSNPTPEADGVSTDDPSGWDSLGNNVELW